MKKETASIEINGKTIEFQYDYNALADAEEHAGCNLQDALEGLLGAQSMTCAQLRGLIFGMIIPPTGFPAEPPAQINFCGSLVKIDTLQPLREALMEACTIAVSEEYHQKYLDVLAKAKAMAEETDDKEPVTEEVPVGAV